MLDFPESEIHMTNPYYAKRIEGIFPNLKIVENFFIPSQKDLERIGDFIEDCETCIDVGSGYGALTKSIADKVPGTQFTGIDTMYWDKDFPVPESKPNLKFEFNGIEAMAYADKWNRKVKRFECVLCCWMPYGSDWREMLSILARKKIILILSRDFTTGMIKTYTGIPDFKLEKAWISNDSLIQLWRREDGA